MPLSIEEMNAKVAKIAELRIEEARLSAEKRQVSDLLAALEGEMVDILREHDMDFYTSPNGKVGITHRTSVRTPKTEEEKKAFYNYLQERGIYDSMISVNSQRLNAFYREEFELAREQGNLEFSIPGLNEVTVTPILSFRKA